MKKNILLTFLMLVCAAAHAQMQPDSTVYIVAHWTPGDKYAYDYSSIEYTIQDGDTTDVSYAREIQIFEVLSATDSTYQMSLTYKDEINSEPYIQKLNELLLARYGESKCIFTTDQHGTLISIDNKEEISTQIMSVIDDVTAILAEEDGETVTSEEMKAIKEYMTSMFGNPDHVAMMMSLDINRFLYFHGTGMKLGEVYEGDIATASLIPDLQVPVTAHTKIYLDQEYTDEYSAVCRAHTTVSGEDVIECMRNNIVSRMQEYGHSDTEIQDAMQEINAEIGNMACDVDEYTTVEVHLNTGWPLKVFYDKYITVTTNGKPTGKEESWELTIILPETEE